MDDFQSVEVGQVFTPIKWAEWLIERWGIFDAWIDGASVCDPTAGQGAFALALFRLAKLRGVRMSPELLSRLTLIEVRASHLQAFQRKARRNFAVDFPASQLLALDVITNPPNTDYDILFGNPPWANFADLSDSYKERLKSYFVAEGLVPDKKQVLLGSSRTDIAALVLKVVLGNLLCKNGIGCFYLPLSIFSGDAHRGFRDYVASGRRFAVDEVCEFTATEVFEGVGTSYCCAKFRMDVPRKFPVKYFRERGGEWIEHRAVPLKVPDDQWRVLQRGDTADLGAIKVELSSEQKPRQGVNTCGANAIFMFEDKPAHLPGEFLFPLATKEIWKNVDLVPHKWILLPYYRNTGRPLSWASIEQYAELSEVRPFL